MQEHNLNPIEKIEIKNPFTGEVKSITLDRTGHHEQRLIEVLVDPKANQDRKDWAISMYFSERGKETMSMMVEMFRYKGAHTKESRLFQSRMRLDFEMFVGLFTNYLRDQSKRFEKWIRVDLDLERQAYKDWLDKQEQKKGRNYRDYHKISYGETGTEEGNRLDELEGLMIEQGIFSLDMADHLTNAVQVVKNAREAEKGGGIYIDKGMKLYSINDPDLDEIIKKDKELQEEANKG